jgi:hypothetical protein
MKKISLVLGIIILLAIAAVWFIRQNTKTASPEADVNYEADGLSVHVFYNRPFKKNRVIFDSAGLVPFGKVWRTGANEATIFETNKDLIISGKTLKTGKYTLWVQPNQQTWTVIFNSEYGQWGINFNGEANRDPENDVLSVEAPVLIQDKVFEQFTISVEKAGEEQELVFIWDKTLVAVPFTVAQ